MRAMLVISPSLQWDNDYKKGLCLAVSQNLQWDNNYNGPLIEISSPFFAIGQKF